MQPIAKEIKEIKKTVINKIIFILFRLTNLYNFDSIRICLKQNQLELQN